MAFSYHLLSSFLFAPVFEKEQEADSFKFSANALYMLQTIWNVLVQLGKTFFKPSFSFPLHATLVPS